MSNDNNNKFVAQYKVNVPPISTTFNSQTNLPNKRGKEIISALSPFIETFIDADFDYLNSSHADPGLTKHTIDRKKRAAYAFMDSLTNILQSNSEDKDIISALSSFIETFIDADFEYLKFSHADPGLTKDTIDRKKCAAYAFMDSLKNILQSKSEDENIISALSPFIETFIDADFEYLKFSHADPGLTKHTIDRKKRAAYAFMDSLKNIFQQKKSVNSTNLEDLFK